MRLELKIRKIGKSLGIVLSKELLTRLDLKEGDTLTVTEAQKGVLLAINLKASRTTAVFESLNRRYQNTLKELAN